MDCSMPGLPVHHQLPEITQTHVHWVSDAIQLFHPVIPFSHLQSFPASRSFPMSQLFTSGGQSIETSSWVLPANIQGWFPLGWTGLISLQSKGSQESSPAPQFKSLNSWCSTFFIVQPSHPYMTTGKTIALTRWTFVGKVMSLFFNKLSRFVIAFLPRTKCLLISWLQSLSAVILEPQKRKSVTVSTFSPLFAMKWWDWMPWSVLNVKL